MKSKTIYYIIGTIILLWIIGYFTGLFKSKKTTSSTNATGSTTSSNENPTIGRGAYGGIVSTIANQQPVVISSSNLDCAKVSGLTGTLQIDGQQFYCSGTFQCTADGKITCQNPTYYYYPYYYNYRFPFFRGGHHGGGIIINKLIK